MAKKHKNWEIVMIRAILFLFCFVTISQAELITGLDTLKYLRFDFSNPESSIFNDTYDIMFAYVIPGGALLFGSGNSCGMICLGDKNLDEIETAPDTGYVSQYYPHIGDSMFCIKTREGNYAKFRWHTVADHSGPMVFNWVYQNDGTKNFKTTGINSIYRKTSWGELKNNYR
jgi:hypothetical protein